MTMGGEFPEVSQQFVEAARNIQQFQAAIQRIGWVWNGTPYEVWVNPSRVNGRLYDGSYRMWTKKVVYR